MKTEIQIRAIGIRRRGGWLVAFIREDDHTIVSTCKAMWEARKAEIGGPVDRHERAQPLRPQAA